MADTAEVMDAADAMDAVDAVDAADVAAAREDLLVHVAPSARKARNGRLAHAARKDRPGQKDPKVLSVRLARQARLD